MNTYCVTNKSDGAEVYRYTADAPVEWRGFEFATHDHLVALDPVLPSSATRPPPLVFQPIEFMRRFTPGERMAVRYLARADQVAEDFLSLLEIAPVIHANDIDVIRGLGYLTRQGCLAVGRADEILGTA